MNLVNYALIIDNRNNLSGDGAFVLNEIGTDGAVPESSTPAIFDLGLAGLGIMRRRRKLN